ncbi:MAG: hypothetical protein IPP90_04135 [Gemmatimonadaceae bacterium]|nr:hypothetical protein [Gemmatimonadaceae bacterium]
MPRIRRLALAIIAIVAPRLTAAQVLQPRSDPASVIEVITLRSVKFDATASAVRIKYERAGLKPLEVRISTNEGFRGASWVPFTEGSTKSAVEGSTTWITGFLTPPGSLSTNAGNCGTGMIRLKAYVQFQGRDRSMQTKLSAIKSDSTCFVIGG